MRYFPRSLGHFPMAFVAFLLCSSLFAALFSTSGLTVTSATIALGLATLATAFALWKTPRPGRNMDASFSDIWYWKTAVSIAFALFAGRAFLWLIFQKGEQIAVLSRNNLGDLPLHIQYIRFFSQGAPFWPVNPVHVHSSIGYPFGVDYFNAVLDICGFPLWNALIVTGILGSIATGMALYQWGRSFGLAGFLFNGGTAALAIFSTGEWIDYQQAMDWKSLPLALFVTQRGFLYALPAGLLLLTQWRRIESNSNEKSARLLPVWLEWLIYASMPLFHIHTFLFLSAMLGALALFGRSPARYRWLICFSLVPATILVYFLTDGFHAASQITWFPGWMQGEHFSALYWLRNFGALPFFLLWLIFVSIKEKNRATLVFVIPASCVFIATLFVKFSPWEWDNTKLMMWSYLALLPFLWESLLKKTSNKDRAVSCFLLFGTGFISLWPALGSTVKGYDIANQAAVYGVAQAVEKIPIQDVFAAASGYAHPLVFAGRRLALGYHGHMVGHGIPYLAEKEAMDRLMLGGDDWERAAEFLGVRYIYWGIEEEKTWPASEKPWISTAELAATGPWGEIYKLP